MAAQVYEQQRDPVADLDKLKEKLAKRNAAWYDPKFNNMRKEYVKEQRDAIDDSFGTKALKHQIKVLEYLLSN